MNQNWKMTQKTIQSKSQEMKKAASRMMEIKRQPNQVPYFFFIFSFSKTMNANSGVLIIDFWFNFYFLATTFLLSPF